MKTFRFTLFTIATLLCSTAASAQDFEVDGLYYNLLSASDKTCELAGCSEDITNLNIPASVTTRGMTLTVSSIKESAFEGNTSLLSVSFIDNAMTTVGANSFKGCTNLTQVELSNALETIEAGAFDGCPISKIVIPANVKTVGAKGLSNVTSIEIANGDEPISFSDSIPTLTSAYIGRNVSHSFVANTSISAVTLGTGITEIIPFMFAECKQIKEMSIPANIVSIGDNAFHNCENLEKFTIEDSEEVLTLGEDTVWTDFSISRVGYQWYSCEYTCTHRGLLYANPIRYLYLGRDLTYPVTINAYNRSENSRKNVLDYRVDIYSTHWYEWHSPINENVDSVRIGSKVTRLGDFFFENQKMTSFEIPENCKALGEYCFRGCMNLQSINLTEIDSIYTGCFENCIGLKKVEVGDSVKVLQSKSFANCSNLHIVSVGESISSLPQECFSGCQNLEWISLGSNLSQIGSGALSDCSKITNIEIKNVTPPVFEDQNELSSVNKFDATLYIPQGSTLAYEQSDVWKDFLFKQESEIPEYVYSLPAKENDNSKSIIVNGDLTGAIINQINANTVIETLDLQMATLVLDNQNTYYESGKRVDSHWDDVDVVRGAPYYSYKYYTSPITKTSPEYEYNTSGKLINVITTCYFSDLTNAKLNGNLKSIKLPSTLTALGENAILGTNLTDLYVYSTTPPTAATASFVNTNKTTCVLHVPYGCKAVYENATGWSSFRNIVESSSDNYIEVQPTNENRQVRLAHNDANVTYQWYKYVEKTDNVIDITNILSAESGWEVNVNGWMSNMHDAESLASLSYEHAFNTGDVLSFDWSVSSEEVFDQLQVYLGDELLLFKSGEQSGTFSKTFESAVNGKLNFLYVKDSTVDVANDNAQIGNVKIISSQSQSLRIPEPITGENSCELSSASVTYGDKVYCIVTLADGTLIKTNEFVLEYVNFIKTQPTADNLLVELDTPEDGIKYQWYKSVETKVDDKVLIPISSDPYAWTEANGVWTSGNKGVHSSSSIMTVDIDVEAGDIISFDYFSESEYEADYFICEINGKQRFLMSGKSTYSHYSTYEIEFSVNSHVLVEFIFKKNGYVNGFSDCANISNLKLTRQNGFTVWEDTEITGATTAKLDKSSLAEECMVYCVVTLPNGRTLVSEKVQMTGGSTGIEDLILDSADRYIVYNLYGILVMDTMEKSDLDKLPQGIYIVNGKKAFIK